MFDAIQPGDVFPLLVVMSALFIGLVTIVLAMISSILKTRAREETKREIAAYVAEGTVDKDTAVALLKADVDDMAKFRCTVGSDGKEKGSTVIIGAAAV